MKSTYETKAVKTNSLTAFAIGVLVTGLTFGGVELAMDADAARVAANHAASGKAGAEIVKLEPIVITAKRLQKFQG